MDVYWKLNKELPNALNQEIVNKFLLELKLANCSYNTIYSYRSFLGRFFCTINKSIPSLTSDEVQGWFINNASNIKERTLQFQLTVLSSLFKFCVQEGNLEHTLIKKIWFPRLPQTVPKFLGREEVAKIRQQCDKENLMNQVLIEFLFATGCRVSEVVGLNIEDLDLENRTARVIGKGRKIRKVHFTEKCSVLLQKYIESHLRTSNALFLSSGKRLGRRDVNRILQKIGEEVGINSLHPHQFRHTFATLLLSKGAELSFIADELGHRDLTTTQIYARVPNDEVIGLYRKYMG